MRFLIVTFDPPHNVGGIEGRAIAYTEELVRGGHFVELASFSHTHSYSKNEFHGAVLNHYPSGTASIPKSFESMVNEIKNNKIDAIFLLSGAITLFGLLLLFYANFSGRKLAIFLYGKDILEARAKKISRLILFFSTFLASRIATNSHFTASLLPNYFSNKIKILYPGIDPKIVQYATQQSGDKGKKRILFVGRLVERKGADDLIYAFKELLKDSPDVELEIVGDGPDRSRLEDLSKQLGVENQVRFFGELRGKSLYEKYNGADLFVMPSRRTRTDVEGFGTVFLEAAAFGKPSVGTFSGGIPEAVLDKRTGLLVPEKDRNHLKDSMATVLSDEGLAKQLGSNAKSRALNEFVWEKVTESLVNLFR
jgi:phosphatidylinositol alpha-1,6-mannosyltransferase